MSTIKLSRRMTAEVVSANTVKVVTNQVVTGGGSRNVISWALTASRLGYKNLLVEIPCRDTMIVEAIRKSIRDANALLNHLGLRVMEA